MNDIAINAGVEIKHSSIESAFLKRKVLVDFYLPTHLGTTENVSLLLINDGQDLPVMPFDQLLEGLVANQAIEPLICIGIYCGAERKMEYGTSNTLHFAGLGARAGLYAQFVLQELLPFVRQTLGIDSFKDKSLAGFSLGGLSALDIVLNYPYEFLNVGVFSGSLWWRSKKYGPEYDNDRDRIMHRQVQKAAYYPWLKFFFECGALDELADRNNNGIIDSIDDTLDLIKVLKQKGYAEDTIQYVELTDGMHNVATWARAFPLFLQWAFGKK